MGQSDKSSTVYYLEMLDIGQLQPKDSPPGLDITMVDPPAFETNRDFYREVGAKWGWTDRLVWSDQQWADYVSRPELQTWIACVDGESAGYFELEAQEPGDVEIIYFGLLDQYINRGLGGAMLTEAIRRAWSFGGARRVWLHTCTEDHPAALANYRRRGFELYDTKRE
ncbi:MAG: GNAT family N-acetyltransferase [Phycisphaerae bacterium]|jgi:ribosomal protein S18 acetylase RimI-like enzyme|nr:GNAT family N-acetyltransferase [Phycisphaerae bacterium]